VAEWIGHLMSNWPAWAIGIGVIIVVIIGAVWLMYVPGAYDESMPFLKARRKKHGKK
jgi:uncharacterized protein YpmB